MVQPEFQLRGGSNEEMQTLRSSSRLFRRLVVSAPRARLSLPLVRVAVVSLLRGLVVLLAATVASVAVAVSSVSVSVKDGRKNRTFVSTATH